ncbi:MAG: fibronectin type III domain-containing protein [Candidatus Riflebacteria bacterium]|nr:fibronectin type III domain-containing protein [Candidatus Riflebacteria bacterium]
MVSGIIPFALAHQNDHVIFARLLSDLEFSSPNAYEEAVTRFFNQSAEASNTITLGSSTLKLDEGALSSLAGFSAMGAGVNELVFSNPPPAVRALGVGSIMFGEPSAACADAPENGFMQKVISIASQGDVFTIRTTQATLEEAFSDCSLECSEVVRDSPIPLASRRIRPRHSKRALYLEVGESIGFNESIALDANTTISYDIGVKTRIYMKITIKDHQIKEFVTSFDLNESSKIILASEMSKSFKSEYETQSRYLTTVWFADAPIWIDIYGSIVFQAEGQLSAGFKAGLQQSLDASIGTQMIDGVWSPTNTWKPSFTPVFETSVNASLNFALGPKIYARPFSLPGPYVSVLGKVNFELLPEQKITADLVGDLGIKIDVSDALKLEKDFPFESPGIQIWPTASPKDYPPSVAIISPTSLTNFSEGSTITIKAKAFDPEGKLKQVDFYAGEKWLGAVTSEPFEARMPAAFSGTYNLMAKATDQAGNETRSEQVTIQVNPVQGPIGAPNSKAPGDLGASSNSITPIPPLFDWDQMVGARGGYALSIQDSSTDQMVATKLPVSAPPYLLASGLVQKGKSYKWWVVSIDANGKESSPSAYRYFQTEPLLAAPDFSRPEYTTENAYWNTGNAPYWTYPDPPPDKIIPQLGKAEGNCTWYVYGRLMQLGYRQTDLDAIAGDANVWDNKAITAKLSVSPNPQIYSIAQTDDTGKGTPHVAVVEEIRSAGNILISESAFVGTNPAADSPWNFRYRTRVCSASSFLNYIIINKGTATLQPPEILAPGGLNEPGDLVANLRPEFSWKPVVGAGGYRLNIRDITDSQSGPVSTLPDLPASPYAYVIPAGYLQSGRKYKWGLMTISGGQSSAQSTPRYFQTPTAPDTQKPTISNLSVAGITQTSATISWTTDEGATTQVVFGTSPYYGSSTTLDSTRGTSHSATISGLRAGSLYHYQAQSSDAAGNKGVSADSSFTTSAPPPVVPGDFSSPLTAVARWDAAPTACPAVMLNWGAAGNADSYEIFRDDVSYKSGLVSLSFDNTAVGMTSGQTYTFFVRAHNSSGTKDSNHVSVTAPQPPSLGVPVTIGPGTLDDTGYKAPSLTPTLTWNAMTADRFGVYIIAEPYKGPLAYEYDYAAGTSQTVPAGKLKPNTKYRWNMNAIAGGTDGGYCKPRYFTTPAK